MSTGAPRFCDLLERNIKHLKQEIKNKERRIDILTERLRKLQSQPNPDPALIQEIKEDIQQLELELENTDRPHLNASQEDFSVLCR